MTRYYHIGSQHGRVPVEMWVGRPGNERGMGGAGPSWMKMWFSPGRQTPRVVKFNRLHVDIIRFFFIELKYSTYSSKMMRNFLEILNFNRLFLKLNRFICNKPSVLPLHWSRMVGVEKEAADANVLWEYSPYWGIFVQIISVSRLPTCVGISKENKTKECASG